MKLLLLPLQTWHAWPQCKALNPTCQVVFMDNFGGTTLESLGFIPGMKELAKLTVWDKTVIRFVGQAGTV